MNQRASHFSFGNTGVPYGSIYTKDYVQKKASGEIVKPVNNPFRSSSVQNPNEKGSFQTTNKALMKNWTDKYQPSSLDPSKMKDLRGHHFNMGNYNPGELRTSHKIFYDRKHISQQANKNQQESKIKMRAHHHDFKEQDKTNFQSSYASQYKNNQNPNESGPQSQVRQELGNAINLGNHKMPMITTHTSDYTQKKAYQNMPSRSSAMLQQSSALVLGNNSKHEPMETVHQTFFDQKKICKNQLPEATMKELRATHFNLGSMKQNYNTESNQYQRFNNIPPNEQAKGVSQTGGGAWASKDAKFNASTTNRRELPARSMEPYQKHGPSTNQGFKLGSGANSYQTETGKNYKPKANLDYKLHKGSKQQNNVEIGYDKTSYLTEHKAMYKPKDHRDGKLDINYKAKNTEDHFDIGGQGIQHTITTYQDQYRKDSENTNPMFHRSKIVPVSQKEQY